MDKDVIRKRLLEMRGELGQPEVIEKSRQIIKQLLELNKYTQANSLMAYLDFRNEVKTELLVVRAMSAGKSITVPVVNKADKSMVPSLIKQYPEDLRIGSYGILEPASDKIRPFPAEELDLVIVPGVAFDAKGNRMGYGGGYYDRFLPRLKQGAVAVALAYDFQVVPDLSPVMSIHDWRVQMVITEKGIINCL